MTKNMGWQLWAAPVAAIMMSVAGTGCAAEDMESANSAKAHVEIQVPKAFQGVIARMSVQVDDGEQVDLDASTGVFTGLVIVPSGTRTFVGRAFDTNGVVVGQSQPLQASITAGVVQGVQLMILDITTQQPSAFGPAILGLTYPETGEVDQAFNLSISTVDPDGDTVAIQWTSTCADGVFGDATAATTTWTKPTTGGCALTVSATSSGFSVERTFSVFVFPAGSQQGAVEVSGQFVPAPAQPQLTLNIAAGTCTVAAGTVDSTCASPARPGESIYWTVYAYDGNYNTASISDNCGGTFYIYYDYGYQKSGYWYPPADRTSCIVTAGSTSAGGATSQSQAGVIFSSL